MHLYQHPIVSLEANLFGHLLQSQVIGAVERLAQAQSVAKVGLRVRTGSSNDDGSSASNEPSAPVGGNTG
jgi:hypothetical protein